MKSIIKIENQWIRNNRLIIGLSVQSMEKFPIVVGCSFQTSDSEIVDIPARFLLSSGPALWCTQLLKRGEKG